MQIIKSIVAVIQQLVRNVGDGLHRTGNINAHRVVLIQAPQQVKGAHPAGYIIVHGDLLADNPLFFFHRLRRKVRVLHKVQQNLQRLVKVVAALEQIAGLVKGSIRIGRRTGGRKALKSVQLLGLKQLVLQKVCNSFRYLGVFGSVRALKAIVNGAILGTDHRISRAVMGLRHHKYFQPRRVVNFIIAFVQNGRNLFFHCACTSSFSATKR